LPQILLERENQNKLPAEFFSGTREKRTHKTSPEQFQINAGMEIGKQ
jgi:hypothetical protein